MGDHPEYTEGIAGDGAAILRDGVPMRISEIIAALDDAAQPPAQAEPNKVDGLAMMVRRLVHALRKAAPDHDLPDRASDYLARHGLQGSLLRAEPSPDTEQPTEPGWRPVGADKCPITGRPFWGNIEHPDMGRVATYGGPFDTYTIPALDEDDELRSERYDHDQGSWIEGGEPIGYFYSDQQPLPPAPEDETR